MPEYLDLIVDMGADVCVWRMLSDGTLRHMPHESRGFARAVSQLYADNVIGDHMMLVSRHLGWPSTPEAPECLYLNGDESWTVGRLG